MLRQLPLIAIMGFSVTKGISASDWPQFLGPARNGVYGGSDVAQTWPAGGPPLVWKKETGHGFSGLAVSAHKLILFHRLGNQEDIDCLDARTGAPLWQFAYPTGYEDDFGFDDGPRATPAIDGGRVYTFGAEGMLHCVDFASGKKIWSVDTKKEFAAQKGFFGMACSPLIEGTALIVNIGGMKGSGIVAFAKEDGKVLWKTSEDEAGYSSPVAATLGGQRYVLFLTREGFIAADPIQGGIRFQCPWRSRNRTSVNAATPLVLNGDTIFLSASYGTGAILFQAREHAFEKVWSGDDLLSNHYATSVERDGFLYGIHGRTDPGFRPGPKLRCVDLKTRSVRWETDTVGAATISRAGALLLILTEQGELVNAAASPEGFQPNGRAQILRSQVRAYPAIADGFFYARSKDELVCLDLRKAKDAAPGLDR